MACAIPVVAGDKSEAARNTKLLREAGNDIEIPAGIIYVDQSTGPVIESDGPIIIRGHAKTELHGLGGAPETPVLRLNRKPWTNWAVVETLSLVSEAGSCVEMLNPGHRSRLQTVFCRAGGAYGIKIKDADGLSLDGVACYTCKRDGVVVDRWHAGFCFLHCHGCERGFIGQGVRGVDVAMLRCESNRLIGLDLDRCESYGKAWNCWFENNGFADAVSPPTGHPFRQYRLRRCKIHMCGHLGEGDV